MAADPNNKEHIVEFGDWCNKCVYRDYDEMMKPCFECLDDPVNMYTRKPTHFQEGPAKPVDPAAVAFVKKNLLDVKEKRTDELKNE